ncbi:DNA primase [Ligilactobacillus saerimneri]|uniref:DNA primase n=1 Tax=Ligilactobacillus saerimneri TaxID=228229 RepID=UPI0024B1A4A9|nr:DNA primase [Ligilactobacillus saerimneri]MDI9205685.1 DNA primase [Ligilactobacillus saerimneri]
MLARIPEEVIDNVRSSVNIYDIVSQFVQLHRSGSNWFGLCPFHSENTPSFSVNEKKQIFHCFSCGRGGNVFKFLMELQGLSFPEAVFQVAEAANITIDDQYRHTGQKQQVSEPNRKLLEMYQTTVDLYHYILMETEVGQAALDYVHARGLSDELLREFKIGFAPDENLLEVYLKDRAFDDYQLLHKSGLFVTSQEGQLFDRFKGRVMFPIRDAFGRPVAFSGRILVKNDQVPKYLNSPETDIFNKRKILFNFDKAKAEIRRQKEVILFEGFMDVLAAYRAGVKNGVASMGTSLTEDQIYLLERHAQRLLVCYDGDEPGQRATKRTLDLLEPYGKMELGVIMLPDQMDPDETLHKYGLEHFAKILQENRVSPIAFFMQLYRQGRNMRNEDDQVDYLHDVLPELAKTNDRIQQDLYLNRLADEFHLERVDLRAQLDQVVSQVGAPDPPSQRDVEVRITPPMDSGSYRQYSQVEKAERLLLYRALHDHVVWTKLHAMTSFNFVDQEYQLIYTLAEGYFNIYQQYESATFLDYLQDDNLRQVIVSIEMADYTSETSMEEVEDCLRIIMEVPLHQEIGQTQMAIKNAERQGDFETLTGLTAKLIKLLQKQQTN